LQVADIVNPVAHHGQPRQAQSEGETVPHFGSMPLMRSTLGCTRPQPTVPPNRLLADRAANAAADQALDVELEPGSTNGKKPGRTSP